MRHWVETGRVVTTHPKLTVRLMFGCIVKFKKRPFYRVGDTVFILTNKEGIKELVENHTELVPCQKVEFTTPEDVDYDTFTSIEECGLEFLE